MSSELSRTHLVLVWERGLGALDRILDDATDRFAIRDVVTQLSTADDIIRSARRVA